MRRKEGKGNGEREVEREDGAKTRWCSRARREVEEKEKEKRGKESKS